MKDPTEKPKGGSQRNSASAEGMKRKKTTVLITEGKINKKDVESDWRDRLKTWKNMS